MPKEKKKEKDFKAFEKFIKKVVDDRNKKVKVKSQSRENK